MEKETKAMLEENGFDVDGTLQRFVNNEALYMKCMKKYLDDNNFDILKESITSGNCSEAFKAAHTMKGFVSNLGINDMYKVLTPMVEKLRSEDLNVNSELEELERLYHKTYDIIENL